MTAPDRCPACSWEHADTAQENLMSTLMDQGCDPPLPTAYQVLGPKPQHTCTRSEP